MQETQKISGVQGLRGIAVLAVILFHSQIQIFHYGYLGVDLFFVISGYVVALSCLRRMSTGDFTVVDFFRRRVSRLFPAFFAVTIIVLFISFLMQSGFVFRENSVDALSALFYVSNFRFMTSLDYFAVDALSRAFTHYWSLSIEEQFYLIFPFLLPLLLRMPFAIWVLIFTSVLCYYALNRSDSVVAFYFSFGRAFPLFFGVSLAMYEVRGVGRPGMASLVFLSASIVIWGVWELPFDALATAAVGVLVIKYRRLLSALSFRPFVWLGGISYSLYLVHWPVVVFLTSAGINTADFLGFSIYLLVSLSSGWLIFVIFEGWFSSMANRALLGKKIFAFAGAGNFITALVLLVVMNISLLYKGKEAEVMDWSSNLKENMRETWSLVNSQKPGWADDGVRVAILGDSTAKDLYNAMYAGMDYKNIRYYNIAQRCGINYYPDIGSHHTIKTQKDIDKCEKSVRTRLAQLERDRPDVVLISSYWKEGELEKSLEIASWLSESVTPEIIYFGPPVMFGTEVSSIAKSSFDALGLVDVADVTNDAQKLLDEGVRRRAMEYREEVEPKGFAYVNRWDFFCIEQRCPVFNKKARLLVADKFHLTMSGAEYFGMRLKDSPLHRNIVENRRVLESKGMQSTN